MFGSLGLPELVMIFLVALLLFGPRKLPEIGRTVGKALGEFRRASNDLKRTLEDEVAADELRDTRRDLQATIQETVGDVSVQPTPLSTPSTPDGPLPETPQGEVQASPEEAIAFPPAAAVDREPS